ncbi:MAG: inositol monophosphatase [Rhizobiaceae bacterium]
MSQQDHDISQRLDFAKALALEAGELALKYFRSIGDLEIKSKGVQDMVSDADLNVETFIREKMAEQFPEDGIVGEEHGVVASKSGFTWVIDPIDGTANFVNSIPAWCVILACVQDDDIKIGVICEPNHGELYWATTGSGAFLNDQPISVAQVGALNEGNTGLGMNSRTPVHSATRFVKLLAEQGGLFYRNASGGLMLAYVAAGRLIGYAEHHMNAWDCLAGQLLIKEAGGVIEQQSAEAMLRDGGRVIASGSAIFDQLVEMADASFED